MIKDIRIIEDRTDKSTCKDGFLKMERLLCQTVFEDGTTTEVYPCDIMTRSKMDSVAVIPWYFGENGKPYVILKKGVRPAVYLRHRRAVPVPEKQPPVLLEAIAGVLEYGDSGLDGVAKRAVEEAREECGVDIPKPDLDYIGVFYPTPGGCDEAIHLYTIRLPEEPTYGSIEGDGSTMEVGTERVIMSLSEASLKMISNEIRDMKTFAILQHLCMRLSE